MPLFVHDMKDLVEEPKLRDYNYPLSLECDVHVRGYASGGACPYMCRR